MRIVLVCFLLLFCNNAFSQSDSTFVVFKNDRWVMRHQVASGDNIFILSKRYHAPLALLADINGLNFQDGLEPGSIIDVPVGEYNLTGLKVINDADTRKLYYRVTATDNLFRISKYAMVPQRVVQQWNNLSDNSISAGQVLYVGKLMYDGTQVPFPDTPVSKNVVVAQIPSVSKKDTLSVVSKKNTLPRDSVSEIEKEYLVQTDNERNVFEEKGAVSFFALKGRVGNTTMFFAFHNTTARGTIIKIHNPGNGRVIFAKVLGPIPDTKQYHNCILGLSSSAKSALGVSDEKAWCELRYAGY